MFSKNFRTVFVFADSIGHRLRKKQKGVFSIPAEFVKFLKNEK